MKEGSAVSGHDRFKGIIFVRFLKILVFWRNVKKIPNFGALSIAWKSPNARWQANTRVLSHYLQVVDNETFV